MKFACLARSGSNGTTQLGINVWDCGDSSMIPVFCQYSMISALSRVTTPFPLNTFHVDICSIFSVVIHRSLIHKFWLSKRSHPQRGLWIVSCYLLLCLFVSHETAIDWMIPTFFGGSPKRCPCPRVQDGTFDDVSARFSRFPRYVPHQGLLTNLQREILRLLPTWFKPCDPTDQEKHRERSGKAHETRGKCRKMIYIQFMVGFF